jgi:hypothetical protein
MKRCGRLPFVLLLFLASTLPLNLNSTEPAAASRVLRVKAIADEAFRDKKNWEKEIREDFGWANREHRNSTTSCSRAVPCRSTCLTPTSTPGSRA